MDIVVRTPHGAADVAVLRHEPHTTLHDLIRLVTGQAVPSVAEVDGRAVDTDMRLAEGGLMMGSVVDTTAADLPTPGAAVALLQLAGPGAGTLRALAPGRYRLGPGRRINAEELDSAAVELTALELTVGDDGTVEAQPGYSSPVQVNGRRITEPSAWTGGMLSVGGRVFAVESPITTPARRPLPRADEQGMVPFHRPPRSGDDGPRQLVVDAVRDAVAVRPALWRQRAGDLAAFTIPFGLAGDPPGPITVDLATERGIALVGDERFTTALARTLLVEATTLHGPADLDVAIATSPDQLARWDWAKWLPHVRDVGAPRFISNEPQLHEWVAQLQARAVGTAGQLTPSHLTLLVVDDPDLWTNRDSPLVALIGAYPAGLRLLTLVDRAERAPAACTAIITATGDGAARLVVPDRRVDVAGVVPALTSVDTATTVARHLAPLDDTERPTPSAFSALESAPASLRELLEPIPTTVDPIVDGWRRCPEPLPDWIRVPLGVAGGERLTTNIGRDRNALISGARPDLAGDVAVTMVTALAAQLPPAALSVVHVAIATTGTALDAIDELPQFAGRFGEPGASAATRLILRLAHVAGGLDPDHARVLVVLDDARQTAAASPGLADGLIELADALPALQLLMTTDDRRSELDRRQRSSFPVQITVDDIAGNRRGSLRVDSERVHTPFVPYRPRDSAPGAAGLVVRPSVYGRPYSSLERRLDLLARHDRSEPGGDEVAELVAATGAAADRLGLGPAPSIVPAPLPTHHRSETLLRDHQGDAIPLGLVDRPERGDSTPLWWQPGEHGSLLLFGSPRSGIDVALSTLILGAPTRFAADDLHIYTIDPLNRRRIAAGLLPHTGVATTPDRVDDVGTLLDWLAGEAHRRLTVDQPTVDEPALLLIVHDLGQLRRHLAGRDDVLARLDTIAGAAAAGVNVVATAWRVEEAGTLLGAVSDRIVGAMAEPADYELLGVVDPAAIEGRLGRCWSAAAERIVQLATPPASLPGAVSELRAEPATTRPPARPVDSPDPVVS